MRRRMPVPALTCGLVSKRITTTVRRRYSVQAGRTCSVPVAGERASWLVDGGLGTWAQPVFGHNLIGLTKEFGAHLNLVALRTQGPD